MPCKLILTRATTATLREVDDETALAQARAEWAGGGWTSVRLISGDGVPVWRRGAADPEADARDRAAFARALGLSRLTLACDEIGGLADLDAPLSEAAASVELSNGMAELDGLIAPGTQGLGACPRLRDLLTHLDARLAAPATLTGWSVAPGPWPNPAHWCATVTLTA